MNDSVLAMMCRTPEEPPVFKVGQTVRVVSRIDCNMPAELSYWLNSKCTVIKIIARGFVCREFCYELRHENGRTCEFKKSELDLRSRTRNLLNTTEE